VKAVNLLPPDARRGGGRQIGRSGGAVYLVIGVMVAALALIVVYVLAGNKISDRKAQLATVQTEAANARAEAARLAPYTTFAALASARTSTVRQIAAARFDWHQSLSDLSRVVPKNTSLQTLAATVAPGASGGGGIAFRSAISAPAFELNGCTSNQDDVASLMKRLRLMRGVTRVTLQSSNAPTGSTTSSAAASVGPATGCGPHAPAFQIVVFFTPIPNAGIGGPSAVATSVTPGTTPAAGTTPASTAATTTPPPATTGTATTPTTTPTGSAR